MMHGLGDGPRSVFEAEAAVALTSKFSFKFFEHRLLTTFFVAPALLALVVIVSFYF